MTDVFISYDSEDRAIAERFAVALQAMNWKVWWDREIPVGRQFDQVIEQQISSARCVVVLWSKQAVESRWVRAEASAAATRNVLVPAMIEETTLPLEFRAIQTAMLVGWTGDTDDREFRKLMAAIAEHVAGTTGEAKPLPPPDDEVHHPRRRLSRAAVMAALTILVTAGASILWWATTKKVSEDNGAAVVPAPAELPKNAATTPAAVNRDPPQHRGGDGSASRSPISFPGSIGAPSEVDTYTFDSKGGRRVYFQVRSFAKELFAVRCNLVDELGTEVFNGCLGCGDPGVHTLDAEGRYTLTVGGSGDAGIGEYELMLFDVPAASRFDIAIGDTIGKDLPGPGAGIIESPGTEDQYRFTATPRQRVFFRVLDSSTNARLVNLRLTDDAETVVLDTCLGCGDTGTTLLRKGGAYELTVGSSDTSGTGTYRLRLTNVPAPHRFPVTLPARIEAGVPGEGAGLIETPGAEDVYSFDLPAEGSLSLKMASYDAGITYLSMRLLNAKDEEIANACLGCGEPKLPRNLPAGPYRVVIGSPKDAATGEYVLEIATR